MHIWNEKSHTIPVIRNKRYYTGGIEYVKQAELCI